MTKRGFVATSILLVALVCVPALAKDASVAPVAKAKVVTVEKAAPAAAKTEPAVAKTAAATQPAVDVKLPEQAPKDASEAIDKGKEIIAFAQAKNWWGMSAAIIWLLMFIMKISGLFKKIGKRWAYIIVPSLSIAAMLLSKFAGDLSWSAAIYVLTSGPSAALLNDFVKRGLLNKEPETKM
jgi:hypothetical protein